MANILNSIIFKGMSEKEQNECLHALGAYTKSYNKGETIFYMGDATKVLGMVLEGSVTVEHIDIYGNTNIISHVGVSGYFGEIYALLPNEKLQVQVIANENCQIMFLDLSYLLTSNNHEPWNQKLIMNLLHIAARKNIAFSKRNMIITPKTIRERVLTYLNSLAISKGSNEFDIPFSRQQLADYLNVERTALSKELSKMRSEGLIENRKKHFRVCLDTTKK